MRYDENYFTKKSGTKYCMMCREKINQTVKQTSLSTFIFRP